MLHRPKICRCGDFRPKFMHHQLYLSSMAKIQNYTLNAYAVYSKS